MAVTRESLVEFMVENFGVGPHEIGDSTPLFSAGLLDSFCMINLIVHIEKAEGIRIGATEVTLDNLDTVARILAFVASRAAKAQG